MRSSTSIPMVTPAQIIIPICVQIMGLLWLELFGLHCFLKIIITLLRLLIWVFDQEIIQVWIFSKFNKCFIVATSEPSVPPKDDKTNLPDQVKPQIRPSNEAVTRRSISTPLPNTHHQWRSQRYNDEKENRLRAVKELEAELAERELSRHNRKFNEQEMLRLRLQVEGLVLERREPPREEFPGFFL